MAWSNVGAISQSTSDGSNRHTKRVGVIFKTEDGTPAGILNNRWWPGGRGGGRRGRRSNTAAGKKEGGGKKSRTTSRNIRANRCDRERKREGERKRESDRQRGNWEIETEPALSDVGKRDAIRDTIGDSLDAHEFTGIRVTFPPDRPLFSPPRLKKRCFQAFQRLAVSLIRGLEKRGCRGVDSLPIIDPKFGIASGILEDRRRVFIRDIKLE